jgi:hypothetical protein
MKKISLVLVLTVVFLGSIAYAEIFKWVDDKGAVHFSDDYETIPEKYRQQLEKKSESEASSSTEKEIRSRKLYDKDRLIKENETKPSGAEKTRITRYTKDEFERLIIGKTRDDILNTIGNPSSVQASSSRGDEFWYYKGGVVYDPITGMVFNNIQIVFKYYKMRMDPSYWKNTKEDYFAVRINY